MKLVTINNIRPGMMVGTDIPASTGNIALVRKGTILDRDLIGLMHKHNIPHAFIMTDSERAAAKRDAENASAPNRIYIPAPKPAVSAKLRDDALKDLGDIFKSAGIGASDIHASTAAIVKSIDSVVDRLTSALDGQSLVNIMNLKSYDDYTYHHSLSVAVLTVAIGQRMGVGRDDLRRLAKGALLHDIGKTSVPVELINKPARLNPEEFSIIKGHSGAGYDYLAGILAKDDEMLSAVLHHHEKMDGSGYPHGLKDFDIPLWSRIIAVADVYDALTSNRPYRTPLQPGETVEFLMAGIGKDFDYDVVDSFIKKVELYPVGSTLELSNGKTGVVYNNENSLRPVVRVIPTGEILDLYRDRSCLSIVVTRVVSV